MCPCLIPDSSEKYFTTSLRLYFLFRQAYIALLIRPLSVISTVLHNLFIDYNKGGVRFSTNPGIQLHVYPYSLSRFRLAFLSYFRISPKSLLATPSGAKHDTIHVQFFIISGDVVPVPAPKPVPATQESRTGIRTVPKVPAFVS